MIHFHHSYRLQLSEARLLRFAGAGPEQSEAEAAKPKEKEVDHRSELDKGKKLVADIKVTMATLQEKKGKLEQLHRKAGDKEIDQDLVDRHGLTDEDGDLEVTKNDVQITMDGIDTKLQNHEEQLAELTQANDEHLSTLAKTDPIAKVEQMIPKLEALFKDKDASFLSKIGMMVVMAKELKALLDGTMPIAGEGDNSDASPVQPSGNETKPEAPKASNIDTVKQMMKDANVAKVSELRGAKVRDLNSQKNNVKPDIKAELDSARGQLTTARGVQAQAERDLGATPDDPVKQKAARDAKAETAKVEAAVKTGEEALATVDQTIAKLEADVKMIDDVQDNAKKRLDAFNHGLDATASKLYILLDGTQGSTIDGTTREQLLRVWTVIANTWAAPATDGIGIQFNVRDPQEFMKAFVAAGVDTKDLQTNPDRTVADPDAFLKTITDLLEKVAASEGAKVDQTA